MNMPAVSPCWLQISQGWFAVNMRKGEPISGQKCDITYDSTSKDHLLVRFPPLASMNLLLGKVGSWGLIQSIAMCVSTYAKLSRYQARDPHMEWDSAVFTLMVMYDN